jgi:hypothetical protein
MLAGKGIGGMQYKLDPKYLQKKLRSHIIGSCVCSLIIGVLFLPQLSKSNKEEIIWILIISIALFLAVQSKKYFDLKKSAEDLKLLSFEITPTKLITLHTLGKAETNIEAIKSLVIQKRREKVKSLLLKVSNGSLDKIEGFSDIDQLAEELAGLLPKEKVKVARWFHR